MRILVHDYAGHPFQAQLSRELARRGNDVLHLYYEANNTPKGNLTHLPSDPKNLSIHGIVTKEPIQKYNYLKRLLQEIEYGRLASQRIRKFSPEILISANTPLESLRYIYKTCRKENSKFVFWLQDVNGLAAYKLLKRKIPIAGEWIGKYHIYLERYILRNSDGVVLIADAFKPIVESWGVPSKRTRVIPNWAPLGEVPVKERKNSWAENHGLGEKFCFLYTGGLGLKHNPNLLLQLAITFQKNENVVLVVVSEGPGAAWLAAKKAELNLSNLILLDYQPFELMPEVLASGDVLVAILEPDAGIFSVPSKVLTYLCAQRPLLLAVPPDNLASQIVSSHQAGIVVPPDDLEGFVSAAKQLFEDQYMRTSMGINARRYAETHFDIQTIGDQFEALFATML